MKRDAFLLCSLKGVLDQFDVRAGRSELDGHHVETCGYGLLQAMLCHISLSHLYEFFLFETTYRVLGKAET